MLSIPATGFPGGSVVKNLPANAGASSSNPGSRRSWGGGNGNPLQYSHLRNSVDRGAWWAIVHGVTRNQTWLSNWVRAHTHTHQKHLKKWPTGHQMWSVWVVKTWAHKLTSLGLSFPSWKLGAMSQQFGGLLLSEVLCLYECSQNLIHHLVWIPILHLFYNTSRGSTFM